MFDHCDDSYCYFSLGDISTPVRICLKFNKAKVKKSSCRGFNLITEYSTKMEDLGLIIGSLNSGWHIDKFVKNE